MEFKAGWWRAHDGLVVAVFAKDHDNEVGELWRYVTSRQALHYSSEIPMYFAEYLGPFEGIKSEHLGAEPGAKWWSALIWPV